MELVIQGTKHSELHTSLHYFCQKHWQISKNFFHSWKNFLWSLSSLKVNRIYLYRNIRLLKSCVSHHKKDINKPIYLLLANRSEKTDPIESSAICCKFDSFFSFSYIFFIGLWTLENLKDIHKKIPLFYQAIVFKSVLFLLILLLLFCLCSNLVGFNLNNLFNFIANTHTNT